MPLNAALKQLIDAKLAHGGPPQWELSIEDVREAFRRLWTPAITGAPIDIPRIADIAIPGPEGPLAARLYRPDSPRAHPLLVYFHGGGFVKGGIAESDAFCRSLAHATGHGVLSVAYRLAPEHRFPAALDDAVRATRWAAAQSADFGGVANEVILCGESAGGNLAAVTCLRLRADPGIAIRHQILLQPVVDFSLSLPSIAMPKSECLVPRDDLAWYYRTYCGGMANARHPDVSPLFADDLSGLSPALVIAAEFDTLRDEAAAYARRLAGAGVDTHHVCEDGMIHGFLQMGGLVPDAVQRALHTISNALR
jgi:acetyl esterase